MSYAPGELDQRVTITRESLAGDGMGGSVLTTSAVATVWAHVRPKSSRERVHSERLGGESTYLFVLRYRSDIRESDRLVWGGVSYNIRGINTRGGRELYIELDAERGVAQ